MADGQLNKLTIIPFKDAETVQAGPPAGPPFIVQFNPESFTVERKINYGPQRAEQGGVGGEAKFNGIEPRTFSFDFLLDGTGASGEKREVMVQLANFRMTTGFLGEIHRPHFLVIEWGSFLATCVLDSYSVTYKLFRPDGTPLRATLSATFREHIASKLNELLKNLSSPDRTHAHLVKGGEHLSLITHQVYKEPRYYFQVAEANRLNTVRVLRTGDTLYLPPVE